jgi:hypothetical protein
VIRRLPLLLIVLCIALVLNGCYQIRADLNIQEDGSGYLAISASVEQSVRQEHSEAGIDPIEQLYKQFIGPDGSPLPGIQLNRRLDNGWDVLDIRINFLSPEELNARVTQTGLFESFALHHKPGVLSDRFILTARLHALDVNQIASDLGISPNQSDEIEFVVRMPGINPASNGLPLDEERMAFLWKVNLEDPPWFQAISQVWNGRNIILLTLGGLLVIFIGVLISIAIAFQTRSRRRRSETDTFETAEAAQEQFPVESKLSDLFSAHDDAVQKTVQLSSHVDNTLVDQMQINSETLLIDLKVLDSLAEFNQHVLHNRGTIEYTPGELSITWQPEVDGIPAPVIRVHNLGNWLVTVNGQSVQMTADGVKHGIAGVYRQLKAKRRT